MVASCPLTWSEVETKRACMSTNYSADPASAVPVVDMATNLTYANIHCAMCHGKLNNLHLWNVQIWLQRDNLNTSLQAIRSPYAYWEVSPFDYQVEEHCIITPTAAITGQETKLKQLCRSYANGVFIAPLGSFKNPHCALLWNRTTLDGKIECRDQMSRGKPWLPSMLFVFSKTTKIKLTGLRVRVRIVRVEYNCEVNEVYDPFQRRCIPEILAIDSSLVGDKCTAEIRFLSSEFQILRNNSVLVFTHQKTYSNESFVLVNNTLILCSNFSRNYTKRRITLVDKEKQQYRAIYIITYVGFSLSIAFLLFLLVTYLLFAELRTFPGKKVMHLSCALIAMQSVYLASDPNVVSSVLCAVIGALLHYLILVVFLWMSAIAYNTQETFASE